MSKVERDPAGLLERVPELALLAEVHPRLRRAIEHGKPHAVYRALFWIKWLGKGKQSAPLVEQLLATRRLFIQPLNGAPSMMTYNGIGARPYGSAEPDANDGSHIITLYLVVLFVPVYPFSAYLVRPVSSGGWTFFGKVPLSSVGYLWQRATALLGLVAVLFGAFNALGAMRYNTVQVVNALPAPVTVRIGHEAPLHVMTNGVQTVRTKVGVQDVSVEYAGGLLERGKIEVKRGYAVNAWNVLGAGALYREDVLYRDKSSSEPSPAGAEPQFMCGERTVMLDDVDYVFSTPPSNITMGEHEQVTHRSHLALAQFKPLFCVFKLGAEGKRAEAKSLAQAIVTVSKYDFETVDQLVDFFNAHDDRPWATALADSARKQHDDNIAYHRLYQAQAISEARRAETVHEYRERARLQPGSADAAYLLARLLTGPEADRFVNETQARFPHHAYLLRLAAYRALARADFAEVERLVDALRTVDLKSWQDAVDLELRALAATGKIDKARGLVDDCLKSANLAASDRFSAAVDGALLARFEPQTEPVSVFQSLNGSSESETAELRLMARVHSCGSVSDDEFRKLEDHALKMRLELELLVRKDPKAALARLTSGEESSPGVSAPAWALLLAEAARLDEHHPALSRLLHSAPLGEASAEALIAYVRSGTTSDYLEDYPPEILAAADFVRSRSAAPGSTENQALRSRAAREDMLHGLVSVAMNEWPQ
jgi:hypothetical protein